MTASKVRLSVGAAVIFFLCAVSEGFQQMDKASSRSSAQEPNERKLELKLVRDMPGPHLRAVLRDGSMIISEMTSTLFSKDRSRRSKAEELETRLVRTSIESGDEIQSIQSGNFPRVTVFPDQTELVVRHHVGGSGGSRAGVWNLEQNQMRPCLKGPAALSLSGVTPISADRMVALLSDKENGDQFVVLDAQTCAEIKRVPVDPGQPKAIHREHDLALSPDRKTVAYKVERPFGSPAVLVIRSVKGDLIARLAMPKGRAYSSLRFSPDSRLLVVGNWNASKGPVHELGGDHSVVLYDALNGERVGGFNIDARDGIAMSPDGRWLAAGQMRYKKTFWGERKQAVASVHDFHTGEEVSVAEHRWLSERARFGYMSMIEFSHDGRFLITSSTHEMRVWEVHSKVR